MTRSSTGWECGQGHEIRKRDGYLDALTEGPDPDTRRTFASFGYEWTRFAAIQPEDEAFWGRYFAELPEERLSGAVALDAGCGGGSFPRSSPPRASTSSWPSTAPRQSGPPPITSLRSTTSSMRDDLRAAPFADATFDFVYCLGCCRTARA